MTPRSAIKRMLEVALNGGAELILLDIDLSRRSDEDVEFAAYLREVGYANTDPDNEDTQANRLPHILIVRSVMPDVDRTTAEALPLITPSPFDTLVSDAPLLHWVSAEIGSDIDGMARRAPHWIVACSDNGYRVLPAAHLVASELLASGSYEHLVSSLQRQLLPGGKKCRNLSKSQLQQEVTLNIAGEPYTLSRDGIDTRILFQLSWDLGGLAPPRIKHSLPSGEQISVPVLDVISAHALMKSKDAEIPQEDLAGRLVIIGTSHSEGSDYFTSPIDVMPGGVVLGNAIRSFLDHGLINKPPLWQKIAIVVLLTFAAFGFFKLSRKLSFYSPVIFKQVYLVFNLMLWVPLSFLLLIQGTWIDFIFPQYVVGVYYVWDDIQELRNGFPNRKPGEWPRPKNEGV